MLVVIGDLPLWLDCGLYDSRFLRLLVVNRAWQPMCSVMRAT